MKKLIKTVELPKEELPESFPFDELPIWRLYITETNDNKIRIRFISSHSFVDGSSIFSFLELFINLAQNKEFTDDFLQAEHFPLTNSFKKRDLFTKEVGENFQTSESWKKLKSCKLYPDVNLPSFCINTNGILTIPLLIYSIGKIM